MMQREVVLKAVKELRDSVAGLRDARGIMAILAAAPSVVRKVDEVGGRLGLKGPQKKDMALDILCALLPPLPWWLPESILRIYAGMILERALSYIKDPLEPKR